jgi:hypothetical protein
MSESEVFNLSLSARGLANIPRSESQNDFEFIVGDNHYPCPWYVAAFLSPKLCRNFSVDGTQHSFIVETPDSNDQFCELLSLGRGESIHFTSTNLSFFVSIAREFENTELLFSIKNKIDPELNKSTVIPRLIDRLEFKLPADEEIEFLSSHLYEFSSSSLSKICLNGIEAIVSHPSLKMTSEDFLYEMVISRMDEDSSFLKLLEFVRFEYLSAATLSDFSRIVCEHFDLLNVSLFSAICVRLIQNISPQILNSRSIAREFIPNVSSPLEGIISSLTREYGGNVHDRGIVTVTSSDPSSSSSSCAAKNAADLTADSYFVSKNAPNQWLCYDFGDRRIRLTHYSIRSRHNGDTDSSYLKSWVIEISKDGSHWEEVDRRENDSSLKGRNVTQLFKVSRFEECRLVRLRQIGKNHCSNSSSGDYLVISGFEIFGIL